MMIANTHCPFCKILLVSSYSSVLNGTNNYKSCDNLLCSIDFFNKTRYIEWYALDDLKQTKPLKYKFKFNNYIIKIDLLKNSQSIYTSSNNKLMMNCSSITNWNFFDLVILKNQIDTLINFS